MERKINDFDREIYERKMDEWKYNYPFAAAIIFGNRKIKQDEVMKLIDLGEKRRNGVK